MSVHQSVDQAIVQSINQSETNQTSIPINHVFIQTKLIKQLNGSINLSFCKSISKWEI